jgi:adenylate cyclase
VRLFRFRRFGARLLTLLLGLLVSALGVTYFMVTRANVDNALTHSEANLVIGAGIFDETVRQRVASLTTSARVLAADFAIRQVLTEDAETISSALESYTQRINAPMIALLGADGSLRANSDATMQNENARPFRYLTGLARENDPQEASGFSYLGNSLQVLVIVPIYAPRPEIRGWFGLAFPIDREFAQKIKATTRLEVTFVSTGDRARPGVFASTLSEDEAQRVARAAVTPTEKRRGIQPDLDLGTERYVTLFRTEAMLGGDPITVVLQRPLRDELAAAEELERRILLISLTALAAAMLAALRLSRGISQPVLALAEHTKHIAAGDYARRIDLRREDELGQLATAFNEMSVGLAERDQVRDLLDKNVSPEVAAQLMRDGAILGGQEREVTIVFADLRGFTTMSEKMPAPELLTLLNRYLDRMSGAIEVNGGVIDKFIGDEIMALFGAPVAQSDAADRALAAALAMQSALADFNRELAAEGRAPFGLGIGINTACVVAGNIGSHRRLNYSVIGDGVNVAARLQTQTRKAEFNTNIITSRATLDALREPKKISVRALGTVQVKGRAEGIEIFAVE